MAPAPAAAPSSQALKMEAAARQVTPLGSYVVRPGDTLSAISAKLYGSAADWPALWWANRHKVPNPNLIEVGQALNVVSHATLTPQITRAANAAIAPAPTHVAASHDHSNTSPRSVGTGVFGHPFRCGDGDGDGWDMPCWKLHDHTQPGGTIHLAAQPQHVSTAGMSGFEACVISRESGGNAQIWNPTGHWGLFQFDLGTWESGGGSAASFGNAPASVQQQVFDAVFAARGTQPWAPSDGC